MSAPRDPRFFLRHIHQETTFLLELAKGTTYADLERDRVKRLAVERSIAIIGEAVKNVNDEFKAKHPEVPWRKIRGMRNVVAHLYWDVNLQGVWKVFRQHIPELHAQISQILGPDA
jgi:uncharacterized protein with HEPN domain